MTEYTFTLVMRVHDEAALYAAALEHAVSVDGLSEEEARSTLYDSEENEVNVATCIQTLLDPGVSPDGCEIQESSCD